MIGVSTDTLSDNAAFADKYGFPFPLLSDTDRAICAAYGTCRRHGDERARRTTYVIGQDGRIARVYPEPEVRIEDHVDQVLATGLAPSAQASAGAVSSGGPIFVGLPGPWHRY